MSPPGPPYNIQPINEDGGPSSCVPSGQTYSGEHPHVEMFVTAEDTSVDVASLQQTVPTDVSSMLDNLTLRPSPAILNSSATSSASHHTVQTAMFERSLTPSGTSSLNQGAQSFGTHSSTLGGSSTFDIWTQQRLLFGQAVVATDGDGSHYPICHGVMKPELARNEERLRSYRCWSRDSHFSPQLAASAGLYCVEGTYLKCFACGGGLDGWEPGDDPLREHARYYNWCPYVAALLIGRFLVRFNST